MANDPFEDPHHQRRVPRFWWIPGVIVLALAFWAATSIGERPEFDSGSATTRTGQPTSSNTTQADPANPPPDDSGTEFTTNAAVLPSAGCATPAAESNTSELELTVDGTVLARYSVATPVDEEAAPLLVLVSEPGLTAAELAAASGLLDVNPGWIHIGVDPLVSPEQLGELGIPVLLEEVIATRCVDLARVFVVGFGEGGRVAGAAACSAPQLVTGVAMISGWTEPTCSLNPRVAVRIVGSDDDPTTDTGTALEEVGGAWAEAMGAAEQVVDGRDEDTLVRNWYGPGGATVETTTTVTGGHNWTVAASLALGPFLTDTARSSG